MNSAVRQQMLVKKEQIESSRFQGHLFKENGAVRRETNVLRKNAVEEPSIITCSLPSLVSSLGDFAQVPFVSVHSPPHELLKVHNSVPTRRLIRITDQSGQAAFKCSPEHTLAATPTGYSAKTMNPSLKAGDVCKCKYCVFKKACSPRVFLCSWEWVSRFLPYFCLILLFPVRNKNLITATENTTRSVKPTVLQLNWFIRPHHSTRFLCHIMCGYFHSNFHSSPLIQVNHIIRDWNNQERQGKEKKKPHTHPILSVRKQTVSTRMCPGGDGKLTCVPVLIITPTPNTRLSQPSYPNTFLIWFQIFFLLNPIHLPAAAGKPFDFEPPGMRISNEETAGDGMSHENTWFFPLSIGYNSTDPVGPYIWAEVRGRLWGTFGPYGMAFQFNVENMGSEKESHQLKSENSC
ncbi:hypothetical protein VP01_1129g3 [Puccinia sorghi]|uniref:Uncharacterized protein n=1 Tax=Puccinia sorghi TaxID=27349 RepID=A0A0L6VS67_9BASI|nr:hypothetical protein VP01_1129g3 [Puccinia sorghi]